MNVTNPLKSEKAKKEEKKLKKDIGNRVRIIREKVMNMTQQEFGRSLRISRERVVQIETGRMFPTLLVIINLVHLSGIPYESIIEGTRFDTLTDHLNGK